ncbi:DMT family transporter [Zooshikella sp. RANM57]|uniref:DMT family transporter n=1 Tax=Zooshikella sp. RANM57 TaxID=3425863 RepID=UPI003D6E488A
MTKLLEKFAPILFLVMWSSGAIFVKLGLTSASVWSFLAVRATGALLLLLIIIGIFFRSVFTEIRYLTKKDLSSLFITGLLLQGAYQSCFFLAIYYDLSPGVLALVLGLQPMLTPIVGREQIGLSKYIFLLIGLLGLAIAIVGAQDTSNITVWGIVFGLLSVLAITIGSVHQKQSNQPPLISAFLQYCAASVLFITIISLVGWDANIDTNFIVASSWMIVVVSVGAVLLLLFMLQKDAASKVSVLFYFVPILTMLFDYLVFDTQLSWVIVIGTTTVLASIYLYRLPDSKLISINTSVKDV